VRSDPRQYWIRPRATPIARLLVAAIVALSFLVTVLPLGTTSAETGTMDCCVGKPGHESGSCATGLLSSAKNSQSASPVSHDHDSASPSEFSLAVVAGAGAGEHCGLQAPSAAALTAATKGLDAPEVMLAESELASGLLTVEATAVPAAEPELPGVRTVSKPCSEKCGACSTSITRQQSTLSFAAKPQIPSVRRFSPGNDLQIRPLNRKWLHLRPRAPPAKSSIT